MSKSTEKFIAEVSQAIGKAYVAAAIRPAWVKVWNIETGEVLLLEEKPFDEAEETYHNYDLKELEAVSLTKNYPHAGPCFDEDGVMFYRTFGTTH